MPETNSASFFVEIIAPVLGRQMSSMGRLAGLILGALVARGLQRRQPAGWGKVVRRVLKPEHVERLSDTQVRITLAPCPDFDIEEDETVEVWIPAAALKNSDRPLYAGSFTIKADSYWQRIDNVIQALKEERSGLGPETAVPDFLLTYFACEIVAKSIVSQSKHKGTGLKSLRQQQFTTKSICRALAEFQVNFDRASIDALFSLEQSLASDMSARRLRDKIVHGMKAQYRSAVRQRYASLMAQMLTFLKAVENVAPKVSR